MRRVGDPSLSRAAGPEATFFFEELGQLRRFSAEHGIRQGTWITEIGWSSAEFPWSPKLKTSELDQAAYLVRSVVAAVAQQVRLFNWHIFREPDYVPDPYGRNFGLVRPGIGGPKPGYVAYALCAHHLAQARFVRRLTGVGRACPPDQLSGEPKWNGLAAGVDSGRRRLLVRAGGQAVADRLEHFGPRGDDRAAGNGGGSGGRRPG